MESTSFNEHMENKEVPGIYISYDNNYNPTLRSPNSPFEEHFYSTRDDFMDVDTYKHFIENCIARFRHSKTYTNYKHYLYELGLGRCQLLGNITSDMAEIEMHHNFLNIFDITLLIIEHLLNTNGYVSTFDVVQLLKDEHKQNNIPIVMLSKTAHQLYHNSDGAMVLPARMCFGFWYKLLQKYSRGITIEMARKVVIFLKKSVEYEQNYIEEDDRANFLLSVGDEVKGWSEYNEYCDTMRINGVVY